MTKLQSRIVWTLAVVLSANALVISFAWLAHTLLTPGWTTLLALNVTAAAYLALCVTTWKAIKAWNQ